MKRLICRISAVLCIILAFIGLLLPVMPTVPFLLAALYLAVDSPGIKNFLYRNTWLKNSLDRCQGKKSMSRKDKIIILSWLWISLLFSVFILSGTYFWVIPILVGIAVSWHILHLKNYNLPPPEQNSSSNTSQD